jgi:hypothetical protein
MVKVNHQEIGAHTAEWSVSALLPRSNFLESKTKSIG